MFWIVKVLTTGMGETTADFLARSIGPAVVVGLGAVVFTIAVVPRFAVTRYVPSVYWLAVAMVSVFVTMAADVTPIVIGVPSLVSMVSFAGTLGVIFLVCHRSERTLSIHSITSRRRELFYWATVLVTFALGTATGDMTARMLHLGYLAAGMPFVMVIAIPALGHRFAGFSPVFAFWFASVTTRPLGASFADWMSVSHARAGVHRETGPVSIAPAVLIVAGVVIITVRRRRSGDSGAKP